MPPPLRPVPPPRSGAGFVRVESARVGRPVRARIHSPYVVGLWTHWADGRRQPCLHPEYPCPYHATHARRWTGYLAAWCYSPTPGPCLLEIPADAARSHVRLSDPAYDLRGCLVVLTRRGPAPNTPVHVELTPRSPNDPVSAEEPDVLGMLAKLWGLGSFDVETPSVPEGDPS